MIEAPTPELENALISLVNLEYYDKGIYIDLDDYKRINYRTYSSEQVDYQIMKKMKFKDIGNIFDYKNDLPQPESIDTTDIYNFKKYQRINISKKYNCIMIYSASRYSSTMTFLTNTENIKKIAKSIEKIMKNTEVNDLFNNIDFTCKKNEYIDISYKSTIRNDDDGETDYRRGPKVIRRKIEKENLVFDTESELFNIMNDIHKFFKNKTKELYQKLELTYKRGIIIYGPPGNGKTALIREVIRQIPDITKIIITSTPYDITKVLSELISKMDNKKAIIIIEDIDSLISNDNRSEFLNILDGVKVKSGIYFIGTTNYPEKIDPAFMNRAGRFDRSYKVDNPSENLRCLYFKSKNLDSLLNGFTLYDENSPDTYLDVNALFTKYSEGLSMANLKEYLLITQYLLAGNRKDTVESAVIEANSIILNSNISNQSNDDDLRKFKRIRNM